MDFWNVLAVPRLQHLTVLAYFNFEFNALVFLFSKSIASHYGEIKDEARMRARLRILHGLNLTVFVMFVVSLIMNSDHFPADQISQTFLTLLIAYLLVHLTEAMLLARYGNEITVMGFTRKVETSTSRTLELVASGVILLSTLVVLINIWGLTSSLQTTGVVGFLAVLVFTTKDYWLRDFLSGILLISGERMQRGDVIAIPDEDMLGIILEIRGLQTIIRDLVRGHDIEVPNSTLLKCRVDFYKENPGGVFRDYVDFKIGYDLPADHVKDYLKAVYERACQATDGLSAEDTPRIALKENDDHAVRWRLAYVLRSPHQLLTVRDAVNLAAYELQEEFNLSCSTPVTLTVQQLPPARD